MVSNELVSIVLDPFYNVVYFYFLSIYAFLLILMRYHQKKECSGL